VALLIESQRSKAPYHVTVLEAAPEIGEIGAGIQVTPNFTRLLHQWGLEEPLAIHGWKPGQVRQVRWQNGAELTRFPLNRGDRLKREFGYEYLHIHRADLHKMLYERAQELGAEITINSKVVKYSSCSASSRDRVETEDGIVHEGDLIIAADGARSILAKEILGTDVTAEPTGDSAYRGMMKRECIEDPIFEGLELTHGSVVWLGPGSHVVGYLVRGGQYYNIVVLVPEHNVQEESWTLKGDRETLKKHFEDWDPRLQKLIDLVDTSYVWSLRDRPALERWLHPTGSLIMLGDAAHPMLPYVAQGAASAAEDAGALAECLNHIGNGRSLRDVLGKYQELRIPRAFFMRESARKNRDYFHLPDGKFM
jgi:salicylate hydroxylase